MKKYIDLPTLVYRRRRGDMIQTYKILHNLDDIEPQSLHLTPDVSRTRGHDLKLAKPQCRTRIRQHCFNNRIVNDWNSLTDEIVQAPSINSFKNRLDKFWTDMACKFIHNA